MINSLILKVLDREGGYVNHPADRGGPTNMGITQKTLSDHRGYAVSAEEVQALGREEAMEIYKKNYWSDPGFHTLDRGHVMNDLLFDAAVHHGPARAVKLLQQVLICQEDGVIGPKTREVANMTGEVHLACGYMAARVAFIGRIITRDESQAIFAAGWFNRMAGLIKLLPMARLDN